MTDTLDERIAEGARRHGRVEVVFDGPDGTRKTTVGELIEDARRLAGALQRRGARPGEVVAVQLGSTYEGAVTQAAVALTGAVLLPIVLIYGPRELGFILEQSRATIFVAATDAGGRDRSATLSAVRRPDRLRSTILVGKAAASGGDLTYAELLAERSPFTAPEVAPSGRAMLVYTSGTTSAPKGVQHTHRSLLAELDSMAMTHAADVRQLALFPAGHVAGLLGLLRVLVLGTPTVVLETWSPVRAAQLIDRYALTSSIGAPVMLAGLLDEKDSGAASLATLTEFKVGAAGVPPALIERADAAGIPAYRCYGSSEHPTITSGRPTDPLVARAHTDGRVLTGSEIRIVDDGGLDVPLGAEGEIATRGGELFVGYTDPGLDAEVFLPGGWFRTGDLGRLDEAGFLTVTDRKKDIIIRGGENISAKEVEDVLAEHPSVETAVAVGLPDERLGERVCAVVTLVPDASLSLEDVRAHFAASGLARQKTPERLEIVAELPRTPAGKVQKFVLRDSLRAAAAGPSA